MATATKMAGELRHKVRIIEIGLSQTAGGATETANNLVVDCQAAIEALQGRELYAAQQRIAEVTHRITIRYRTGVKAKHRVWYGGREFQVEAVFDPLETRRFLVLLSIERNDSSRDGQGGVTTPGVTPLTNPVRFAAADGQTVFTLPRAAPSGVLAFLNGQQIDVTDDYTLVGLTFTTVLTLGAEDKLVIFYL